MGLKATIKKSFWGNYMISEYHVLMCKIMPKLMSDEKAVKKFYKKRFGKELDLKNPKTFAEKINWYKLNDRNPLMAKCADKVAVREYIEEKGYGDCLNEVYGVFDNVDDIDIDSLPNQFVIKAAHGSHMNYIVKDKKFFDWKHAKKMMKSWLRQDISWSGREWVYRNIPKRIIIEKFLEDESGELKDYKFFCFNGRPMYMECVSGRNSQNYHITFFDMNMNRIGASVEETSIDNKLEKLSIENNIFMKMKNIAEVLAKPFQQVRVDFYFINNKIYFGELTFFPDGGSTFFLPDEWNYKFAENWIIMKNSLGDTNELS